MNQSPYVHSCQYSTRANNIQDYRTIANNSDPVAALQHHFKNEWTVLIEHPCFDIPTTFHTSSSSPLSSPRPPSCPRSCSRARIRAKFCLGKNAHPFVPCPQPNSHYHPFLPPHPPPSRPVSPHQQLPPCLIINNQKGDAAMVLKYIETSASEYLAGHPQSQSPNCDPWNYTSLTKSQISNHWMSTLSVEQLERNKGGV